MTSRLAAAVLLLVACAALPAVAQQESGPAPLELSLRDIVQQAIERNLQIAVTRLDPALAAESVTVAEAAFDSRIEARAAHSRSQQEPESAFGTTTFESDTADLTWFKPFEFGTTVRAGLQYEETQADFVAASTFRQIPNQVTVGPVVNITHPLLRNFGLEVNRTAIEQAMNERRVSEAELFNQMMLTVEQTEQTYWDLIGARRQLGVAQGSLQLARDFLDQTKIKVEVGTLPPIEITTAEAEVASREEAVIIAENLIGDTEDQLRALLRIPPDSPDWQRPIVPLDEPTFEPVQVDVESTIDDALTRRPEIAQAQLAVRNAELNLRYRENQVRPELNLSADFSATGNNYEPDAFRLVDAGDPADPTDDIIEQVNFGRTEAFKEIADLDTYSWSVGAFYSIPIRNRAAKAERTRARLAVEQANLRLEQARQNIRVEVREAARAVESAARRVASARANVVLQRKKVDAEQKRYENGLSIAFQVLQFQNDLRDAESREIRALVDHHRALATLARVRGTLLTDRGVRVEE
ncbi:MAG: TolC family protein [Acidobacteria bacterium]|nr:TolC family protein [Acidobacteriota bacterium]